MFIHESRFTYRTAGFHGVLDLGAWWEAETGLPLPLGGILARRDLGAALIGQVEAAIRASLAHARAHPRAARGYIRAHAQELDDAVTDAPRRLYYGCGSDRRGLRGEHQRSGQRDPRLAVKYDFPIFMPFIGAIIGGQSIHMTATVTDTILEPRCPS